MTLYDYPGGASVVAAALVCAVAIWDGQAGAAELPPSVVPVVGAAGEWAPPSYDEDFKELLLPEIYLEKRNRKALVFAPNGHLTWWRGARSMSRAKDGALIQCAKRGGKNCKVVAEGSKIVVPIGDYFRAKATHAFAGGLADRAIIGAPDAPINIISFDSPTCPYSAKFRDKVFPMLKQDYVDKGLVRIVFLEYPRNDLDVKAAQLARCFPAPRFLELANRLYAERDEWVKDKDGADLSKFVAELGLDEARQQACLADTETRDEILAMRVMANTQFAAISTPTVAINGYIFRDIVTPKKMKAVLDHFLNAAKAN